MQDLNVVLVVLGVVVSGLYLRYNQTSRPQEKDDGSTCHSGFSGSDIPEARSLFVLQYEQINQRLRSREVMNVVVGSLFLAVSVLLMCSSVVLQLGATSILIYMLVFASLALYSIWLLAFNLPANAVTNRELFQLRQMEKKTENGLNLHSYLENAKDKGWSLFLTRQIWLYPFWVLVAAAVLILHSLVL